MVEDSWLVWGWCLYVLHPKHVVLSGVREALTCSTVGSQKQWHLSVLFGRSLGNIWSVTWRELFCALPWIFHLRTHAVWWQYCSPLRSNSTIVFTRKKICCGTFFVDLWEDQQGLQNCLVAWFIMSDLPKKKLTDIKKWHFWLRPHWVWILILYPTNCSTLGKLLISLNHFPTYNWPKNVLRIKPDRSQDKTVPDSSCLSANVLSWRCQEGHITLTEVGRWCCYGLDSNVLQKLVVSECLVFNRWLTWEIVKSLRGGEQLDKVGC